MNINDVQAFLNEHDYDVRVTHNGRWIDQKCTFDVLCFVTDQIIQYVEEARTGEFTNRDIWKSERAVAAVQQDFVKPDPMGKATIDEYNKFYRQPMKLLSAAGILSERRLGNRGIVFSVRERDLLDFIASREPNALQFLVRYIEKTLRDSGIWNVFETFLARQDAAAFAELRTAFRTFSFTYTPIATEREADRILSKVLNPLAFYRHAKGKLKGQLSGRIITKSDIIYNRPNWRDELQGKDKSIARREYVPDIEVDVSFEQAVTKAKEAVRKLNDAERGGKSEVLDWDAAGHRASHAHHIFPKARVPQIAATPENIIMLTSAQHMERAHPEGNTRVIDVPYQGVCLRAKLDTVRELQLSARAESAAFYSIDRFVSMLDTGLDTDYFGTMPVVNVDTIRSGLDLFYSEDMV